ncbi:MAG: Nif3-like dinuclear metal center hexameric protein [Paenibacillus macerans]|uniref:GTP cyclohydrolase 1 type 2 homolog n=1 Tax=Paenibacillus macerans TaxID=44252 RepID=A0A090ZLM9_PAEMA|nr:Nif3-like dinuclear metal center hexameric protein [Paenibacillus macerans]KFN12294.1 NIF3 family protein [Paenibacillus macerans]MBS5914690.1 Nif3-like dinuclear metal center hexameric protein [Paenibacillus macerans]MCY7558750.1 Nif3-like dinuclear metal center hexameric protein [Paenibacillus macerans]MDU7477156.1 Nif3-like dinuclear metal center hexameric protein [Paenibacillus macerans]MEC0140394.1 Nif3-like dinuclear metal center hexameric protein [Paenibacillus macerans]
MKVGEVIEAIIEDSCGAFRLEKTCDQLISGSYDTPVEGIATTFMVTIEVIKQAVAAGANMIITHEPSFYTGKDATDWLKEDPLYAAKKKLIEDNRLAIWRYHDYMHRAKTDRIYDGLLREIGWENNLVDEQRPFLYRIQETTLAKLARFFKRKLAMDMIQIVGNPEMKCSRVGILVGGGSLGLGREQMPMELMRDEDLDVMVCGEITEWTLCAYVNDAAMLGMNKGMIVLGHERSEEWGMKFMAEWLKPLVGGIPVTFIDSKEPFVYL